MNFLLPLRPLDVAIPAPRGPDDVHTLGGNTKKLCVLSALNKCCNNKRMEDTAPQLATCPCKHKNC